jgi:hypothetical protein
MTAGTTCLIGIPVIAACLVIAPVRAHSLDDVLGWEGAAWGMTESEVTTRMASRGFPLVNGRPPTSIPLAGNVPFHTKAGIAGTTYDVAFRFSERTRGLDAVLMGTLADSPDRAAALHDRTLEVLTDQHGPATSADSLDRRNSLTRWVFETTTIVLQLETGLNVRGRRVGQVFIAYLPSARSDQREASEGMLLLFLLQGLGKGRR